jgi:hypothetical protein
MVSGIISPNGMETFKMIEPSVDGYWTNRDLIKQLEEWLPSVATKYPAFQLVIQFDNSGNHGVYAPDALIASRLNLGDGFPKLTASDVEAGMAVTAFRDTFYVRDGVRCKQTFTYRVGDGVTGVLKHKGIRSILKERGLWRNASAIVQTGYSATDCLDMNPKAGYEGPHVVCSYRSEGEMMLDEALALLAAQPDFVQQRDKNWITETVERYGHIAIFGPKFHPELAAIELFWSDMKRYLRANCDYTLPTLRSNIPLAISSIPLAHFRRYFAHVARYMISYAKDTLTLAQIEWSMRKYTSHRRAKEPPADLDSQFLSTGWFKDLPETLKTEVM